MRWRIALLGAVFLPVVCAAEVKLPGVLGDHAVLQRDQPVRIWGWAAAGEHVTVAFHGQKVEVTAGSPYGLWEAWLRPEKAGGPYTLRVTGDASSAPLERTDILVGDVWLASGQSNMEMPLQGFNAGTRVKDGDKEIAAANHPTMHLLLQKKRAAATPLYDTDDVWVVCTPETAKTFSAVAYFFGKTIMDSEKTPVGLIDTTWGGTPAHAWISSEGLAWSELSSVAIDAGAIARNQARVDMINQRLTEQQTALKAAGKPVPQRPAVPNDHRGSWAPSSLFNGMVAPFVNYTVKGFIWYQGETDHDANRAAHYSRVFPALIQDWRKQWGEGNLPFFFVQIASYGDHGDGWGGVRDAQRRTLELVNTGMAVTLDIGLEKNIHPPDKQTVGARLAQPALGMVYGRKVETSSPQFVEATTEGTGIRAWFSHADGLMTKDAALTDFEVAGADGRFVAATAKIEMIDGRATVIASAADVPAPKAIRYGFQPYVKTYLYNSTGLPMGTFTSESDALLLLR